jgi:MarR family transcriptional regulator, lower aerobic nicotinate degradation pathway regulator
MKYQLLESLLPHLEAYERAYPNLQHPQHFAVWLARHTAETEQVAVRDTPLHNHETDDVTIGKLLFFLTRYVKSYSRKALENSVLGSMDEFVYIVMLLEYGPLTKSDLIQRNRHEKPTGMEIIRRLLASGLIVQADDPSDRRSKRLSITAAGKTAFVEISRRMDLISGITTGNLNAAEKMLLLQLLEKLEHYHQVVLAKTKGGNFEDLERVVEGL